MDEQQQQTWDALISWVRDATELAIDDDLVRLWGSILALPEEVAKGCLLVALLARAGDDQDLRGVLASLMTVN
jgi:hypothetical protein